MICISLPTPLVGPYRNGGHDVGNYKDKQHKGKEYTSKVVDLVARLRVSPVVYGPKYEPQHCAHAAATPGEAVVLAKVMTVRTFL